VTEHRGESYLSQDLDSIDHSARDYLQRLREQGVRVPLDDPPWSSNIIDACALRGPHPSANLFKEFLRDEMADFIEAGFWVVLPLEQVRALNQDLRLSPLAVKDEGEKRRTRVLVDHTWFGVNEHTLTELPPEVMQFGSALPRILWLLRHADPDLGPVYLAKFDIADGFYRLFLDPDDVTKLAVLMPRYDNEPQLVAIPLSLMMGWVSLPPTFCAASETAADLANAALFRHTVPPHRLEGLAAAHDCWESPPSPPPGPPTASSPMTIEPPRSVGPLAPSSLPTAEPGVLVPCSLPQPEDRAPLLRHKGPIAHVDVFVDDFIGVAQGSHWRCRNIRCCIRHAVDKVFA
jgi:hypothetical protein